MRQQTAQKRKRGVNLFINIIKLIVNKWII